MLSTTVNQSMQSQASSYPASATEAVRSLLSSWMGDRYFSGSLHRRQKTLLERHQLHDLARRTAYWLLILLGFAILVLLYGRDPPSPKLFLNRLPWTVNVWVLSLILSMVPYPLLLRQLRSQANSASRSRIRQLHLLWSAWLALVAFVWLSGNWALAKQPPPGGTPVLAQQFFVYLTILGQVFTVVLLSSSRMAVFAVLGLGIFAPFYFNILEQLVANLPASTASPAAQKLTLHIFFTGQLVLYSIIAWCIAVTQKSYYVREILLQSERARAESERARANHFIATISHDVKQPLSALMFRLATLKRKANTPELRAEAEALSELTESLGKMVEASFDLSRLDAGTWKLDIREHGLPHLVERVLDEIKTMAAEKGLAFERKPVPPFLIRTDENAFLRILRNLLGNAIKYTPARTSDGQPGRIFLECQPRDQQLMCVSVVDNGTGIPENKIKDIFKEYVQLDNPERDRTKGFGLGLSIVDRLAHRMGHEIEVESQEGKGSRFSVLVPIGGRIPPEYLPPSIGVDFTGMTVAVIEDDQLTREALHMLLSELGCYVIDGESAEELIVNYRNEERSRTPDLLLCDYRLRKGKTGIEAIEAVRRETTQQVPAVITTAETAPDVLRKIAAAQFEMLPKPVTEDQLRELLEKFSPNRKAEAYS